MSYLRFQHVFAFLMVLSLLCTFIAPKIHSRPQANVQAIFAPVSVPARRIAGWAHDRWTSSAVKDDASPANPRSLAEVQRENLDLRVALANVTAQLQNLKELNKDRSQLGSARSLCTPVSVIGSDAGNRESITLQGGQNIRNGMEVLTTAGLVGRVDGGGLLGARVRVITDPGFAMVCSFNRYGNGKYEHVPLAASTVVGIGNGMMAARMMHMKDVTDADLRENDWVVLDDREWPEVLQGWRVGRITSITQRRDAPGFADVRIEPSSNLMQLREVMVMNKR
jgi:cell shape-determining protein MreC